MRKEVYIDLDRDAYRYTTQYLWTWIYVYSWLFHAFSDEPQLPSNILSAYLLHPEGHEIRSQPHTTDAYLIKFLVEPKTQILNGNGVTNHVGTVFLESICCQLL